MKRRDSIFICIVSLSFPYDIIQISDAVMIKKYIIIQKNCEMECININFSCLKMDERFRAEWILHSCIIC